MNEADSLDRAALDLQAAATAGHQRPHAWALVAPDLTVEAVSTNFGSFTGLEEVDMLGRPLESLLWEFVGAEETLVQVLQGKRSTLRMENVYRDGGGVNGRYMTLQVTLHDDDPNQPRLLLLVEDSNDLGRMQQRLVQDRNELRLARRQLEQANEALVRLNRQKSLFLAMAAHDLRTPLTSIQGFTELVSHDVPDEWHDQQQMLALIGAQTARLQRMIADLLDLDLIEQGRLTIQHRECVLNDMLYQVLAMMGPAMELQSLTLETDISDDPLVIWADPIRLEQILYNLIGNAVKYSPAGGIIAVAASRAGDDVTVQVTNEGAFLSQAQLESLFDVYYRTEGAQTSRTPGSGLGLYIVKMLTEAHGGRINVDSQEGAGNRFSVQLPAGGWEQEASDGR